MKIAGYKLNGYNATYDKTTFEVNLHSHDKSCVLEVEDINSGHTFIVDFADSFDKKKSNLVDFLTKGS